MRLNRRRFWKAAAGDDKLAAYLTLYECLTVTARLLAPFMPFIAERMHQNLVRTRDRQAPVSVHMCPWPQADAARIDEQLLAGFEVVRRVVSLGRAARNASALRTRQPLSRALVRVPDEAAAAAVARHEAPILEELNVKAVEPIARDAGLVSYRLKPNLPRIGRRHGKLIPAIREALGAADGAAVAGAVAAGRSFELDVGGTPITFEPEDVLVETESAEGYACAEEGGFLVGLDTRLTPELECEGLARELVRTVQEARKRAGLDVADRIALRISGGDGVARALERFADHIHEETLATRTLGDGEAGDFSAEHELDGEQWRIALAREPA